LDTWTYCTNQELPEKVVPVVLTEKEGTTTNSTTGSRDEALPRGYCWGNCIVDNTSYRITIRESLYGAPSPIPAD